MYANFCDRFDGLMHLENLVEVTVYGCSKDACDSLKSLSEHLPNLRIKEGKAESIKDDNSAQMAARDKMAAVLVEGAEKVVGALPAIARP